MEETNFRTIMPKSNEKIQISKFKRDVLNLLWIALHHKRATDSEQEQAEPFKLSQKEGHRDCAQYWRRG